MATYLELLEQRRKLNKRIEAAKAREFAQAVAEIKEQIRHYGITLADLGMVRLPRSRKRHLEPVALYQNPVTGELWSGIGAEPDWLQGQDREQFLIQPMVIAVR